MTVQRILPFALTLALIAFAGFYLFQSLDQGRNLEYDEFYSLERSHGFTKFGDWLTVYSYNEPSGKKPPLQYWLNASLMQLGVSDLLATRFWSWVFFLGLLVTASLNAYFLAQKNPWTIPATVLLLCSSTELIRLSQSGLLDSGMSFFMMAGLLFFQLAGRDPRWWPTFAIVAGLGALQKAPVALAIGGVMIWVMTRKKDSTYHWPTLRQKPSFNLGLRLLLIIMLLWPVLQSFKVGIKYIHIAVKKEMLERFSPTGDPANPDASMFKWVEWLWSDIHGLAIIAALSLVAVLLLPRWRRQPLLMMYAISACVIALLFTFASGNIYSRYLSILTPFLICLTVTVISDISPWKPVILIIALAIFGLSLSSVQQVTDNKDPRDTYRINKDLVSYIDLHRTATDIVAIKRDLMPPGAYGYFSTDLQPFSTYNKVDARQIRKFKETLASVPGTSAILGMNRLGDEEKLTHAMGKIAIIDIHNGYFLWRYQPGDSNTQPTD